MTRAALVALAALAVVGCGGATPLGPPLGPSSSYGARCRLGASQTSVLVTEWSAAEKANLEAMMSAGPEGGGVAVAFSGCELRLLPECRLRGGYVWQRTTPSSDRLEIRSQADLFSKLPLGAVSLEGELARSGALEVETTVAGFRRIAGGSSADVPNGGPCAEATHVVSGLSLGAFVLSSGEEGSARGQVAVAQIGETRGTLERSARVVRAAGQAARCGEATDAGPALDCGSPLQVFLAPIPGKAEPEGPVGAIKVDFQSGNARARWDVYVDDEASCTTPCVRWVDPARPLALRARDLGESLEIDRLETGAGPLQVVAHPKSMGAWTTGLVFTSFGGMAVFTGITLGALGCATDRDGMCDAGLITGGVGVAVTAGALWLMLRSRAHAEVRPLFSGGSGLISGTF